MLCIDKVRGLGTVLSGFLTQQQVFCRAKCPSVESGQAWELGELGLGPAPLPLFCTVCVSVCVCVCVCVLGGVLSGLLLVVYIWPFVLEAG